MSKYSKNRDVWDFSQLCEKRDKIIKENNKSVLSDENIKYGLHACIRGNIGYGESKEQDSIQIYIEELIQLFDVNSKNLSYTKDKKKYKRICTLMLNIQQTQLQNVLYDISNAIEKVETCTIVEFTKTMLENGFNPINQAYTIESFLENYAYCYSNKGELNAKYAYNSDEMIEYMAESRKVYYD